MILTAHAKERWAQRMADYDLGEEWASAKPPSKRMRKILGDRGMPNVYDRKVDFMVSRNGVVFVTSADRNTVITVFFAGATKRRYKARKRLRREIGIT